MLIADCGVEASRTVTRHADTDGDSSSEDGSFIEGVCQELGGCQACYLHELIGA